MFGPHRREKLLHPKGSRKTPPRQASTSIVILQPRLIFFHPSCCETIGICLAGLVKFRRTILDIGLSIAERDLCDLFRPRATLTFDFLTLESIVSCRCLLWTTLAINHQNRFIRFQKRSCSQVWVTDTRTDGQTDERTDRQVDNIRSPPASLAWLEVSKLTQMYGHHQN